MGNNNDKKKDPFFDTDHMDGIDALISDNLSRPTLVDQMQRRQKEADKERQNLKSFDFAKEIRDFWWLYLFLCVSALFTGTLGIYMGISPRLDATRNVIVYMTDIPHLMLALIYLVAFVTVTEGAAVIYKWLMHVREQFNRTQQVTAILGMVIAFLSVAGTGVAGGMVIASNISFLSEFVEIPEKAQTWVVIAIPILITVYTVLGTVYALSSNRVKAERLTRENQRARDLDNQTRINALLQIGREKMQVEEIKLFQKLVMEGKITSGMANYALENGLSLADLERKLRKDLDGSGAIGDAPKQQKDFHHSPNGRDHETENRPT